MPSLESLANLGEIIGAAAVVVSLVYLAVQVRQNTRAQRTENFSRALDRVAAIQSSLAHDAEASLIFGKGVDDPTQLSARERTQFTWLMYELFGAFEFMYLASKTDSIPDEIWQRWAKSVSFWLLFAGVREWWEARPIPFTDSFTAFVDEQLSASTTNEQDLRRYRAFVADGKVSGEPADCQS